LCKNTQFSIAKFTGYFGKSSKGFHPLRGFSNRDALGKTLAWDASPERDGSP